MPTGPWPGGQQPAGGRPQASRPGPIGSAFFLIVRNQSATHSTATRNLPLQQHLLPVILAERELSSSHPSTEPKGNNIIIILVNKNIIIIPVSENK
jgi:hypothetical protein